MIDVTHDLPNGEPSDPDVDGRDRAAPSGAGARAAAAKRDRTDAESGPGWDALVALAKLLGRRAAEEHLSHGD